MRRLGVIIAAVLATGCLSPHGVIVSDVAQGRWCDTVRLTIPNEDTLSRRSISLVVRYDAPIEGDTLPVELIFCSPDSLRTAERVTFRIPRTQVPASRTHEAEIPYRTGVIFNRAGDYTLLLVPCSPVAGIQAVGVNIHR